MKNLGKLFALMLAIIMIVAALPVVGLAEDELITITVMSPEHDTELYHPDTWVTPKWAEEKFGIKMDLTFIPNTDWETKRATTIAGQELPDIMMYVTRDLANEYGAKGLFLNIMDYIDYMPNLKKALDDLGFLKSFAMYSDSEIYALPATVTTSGNVSSVAYYNPFIRRDIMTELGFEEMPKTFEELHDLLAAMKAAYPDSYPWVNRQTFDFILNVFAPGLGIKVAPMAKCNTKYAVWNEEEHKFTSLMEEENFKWFLGWMNQLYNEELLDPNYAVDNATTWQDKLINSEGFFSVDYFNRPSTMTASGRQVNPDFLLEAFTTPALEGGESKVYGNVGVSICNVVSAKCKNPERVLAFLDQWLYSEEGALMACYGVEGQAYVINEDKSLSRIMPEGVSSVQDYNAYFGVQYMSWQGLFPDYFGYSLYDANQDEVFNKTWNDLKDELTDMPPTIFMSPAEAEEYNDYATDLLTTERAVFNEFVIGRRNIETGWDEAVEELRDAGYEDYLDLLNRIVNK